MAKKQKTLSIKLELVVKSPYKGSGPRGVDVYARHLYDELSRVTRLDKVILSRDEESGEPVDLVHYTFFDPFFLTLWPRLSKTKYVVTVHDLIPLKFSEHFPSGLRAKLRWVLQKRSLSRASAVITDSICSKTDIVSLGGVSSDKVHVIPLAAGHTTVNEKMVKAVRTVYHLPDRYLLYVGDINWNKNVPGLIRAFSKLESTTTHLVLVGKAFVSSGETPEHLAITQAIQESGKSAYIHILGFVPSHHLPAIYRGALVYVQPSWYEGFGFPVLEAMEQGTPVASSSAGSLVEVGGEFAHYFDPSDPIEMSSILRELLGNKDKRAKYVEDGKKWARSFSWERVVEETHAVYEKVVG